MGAIRIRDIRLYFLPVRTRVPLKFGPETLTEVTCARVAIDVEDDRGRRATGWGETPLSVQWVWPSSIGYAEREAALKDFCLLLAGRIQECNEPGHPFELGVTLQRDVLGPLLTAFNVALEHPLPYLAGLVCLSGFDIALHDAYAMARGVPTYDIYTADHMQRDLSAYLTPAAGADVSFAGRYPADYFQPAGAPRIPAWHLVGGKDPVRPEELTGGEPDDGYPVLLADWIRTDGLKCLKVKLTGTDAAWDYDRLVTVAEVGIENDVNWLSADFNCTVTDPAYVNAILDRLLAERPRVYGMVLYVEQPFPYDLEAHRIDVHSVAARKPLFMDESAHDWRLVKLGRSLGWTGVALKTCKTQTGALLSACWARAHGMTLMVQDLTNPMLAQIPHTQLAWHVGTIMGVETNSMQFYPEVSRPEAAVHPGLFRRRDGQVDLASVLDRPGFGYRGDEIDRTLPKPVWP
ncbi:MAG: enolase C-terminal domain-like protein [Planctomycetota bacterium]